ncbi:MAG: response regulator [Proteobacteria bacterium]|nr:MAG: response regulator [Pseudomonadota bacterium]
MTLIEQTKAPKILIIEDEAATRYTLTWALRKGHFDVIESSSAKEGLARLSENPDLIILDISLPDMSGFEVCAIIKGNEATSSIPILHMSACYSSPADKIEGLERGADAYLVHPVEVPELLATVNALLRMRRSEALAKDAAKHWESTFNAIRDGVCVIDAETEILRSNRAFHKIFPDCRDGDRLEAHLPTFTFHAANIKREDVNIGHRWFELEMSSINESGQVCTFRDITERRIADRDLLIAKRNAEEANISKSRFLANMSHEIRTPLAAIIGFTGLLKSGDFTEDESSQFLDTIDRNGKNLALLIDDILDLSKVEADKMEFESIPFSLEALLLDIQNSLSFQANAKDVTLRLAIDKDVPDQIVSDPARLRQVLMNIVGNALKFTRRGFVSVHASADQVRKLLILDVKDTGRGVAKEDVDKLFQPFSQGDNTTTREFGGTGLGLILSRQLATGMGGDVKLLSSDVSVGSCFRIEVALQAAKMSEIQTPAPLQKILDLSGLKVLIVDDAIDNRTLLTRLLKRHNIFVRDVEDGEQAIVIADEFDVILLDIQMPVLDGYQTAARLKENHYSGRIIALTAHAMPEERNRCLEVGCAEYLTKPIDIEKLLQALRVSAL